MKNLVTKTAVMAFAVVFAGEAIAIEWNVSVWGSVAPLLSMLKN